MTLRTLPAVGLAALLVLAACGDDESGDAAADEVATLAELAALDGAVSAELVERAQEEGSLTIYTSNSDLDDLATTFQDEFDIETTVYRASSETVLQRLLQEARADRSEADVIEIHSGEMELLSDEGVLVPYEAALEDELVEGPTFDDWTVDRYNAFTVAWNPEVLGDEPPPSSWEDLADPRWDGRLSIEAGDFDWFFTLRDHLVEEGASEGEADQVMADIVDGARVVDGHTQQVELLAAGEFAVVASAYTHGVDRGVAAGAPISRLPAVEPLIVKPSGVAMVRGLQHPAAAALFYEWLLTDAQQLLAEDHRLPAGRGFDDPLEGIATIYVDPAKAAADGTEWSRRYQELLR